MTPAELIEKAKAELDGLLPWIDFGTTQWQTIQLDRAEPRQNALLRPDRAFVGRADQVSNTLVAWPTKLSLSPDLGDEIERLLQEDGISPRHPQDLGHCRGLRRPPSRKRAGTSCSDGLAARAGRHRITISAIGLGTVKLGRDQGVKYPGRVLNPR